jgi:hypothetical protein
VLSSKAVVELKEERIACLLEPIVARPIKRFGAGTLAAFKFLVENGTPRQRPRRGLPRAAATC